MAVVLDARLLARYRAFSLYNSPYRAHHRGHAIDLYPEPGTAPSPVAGEVLDVRSVSAPPKPYAAERDHLLLIDVDPDRSPVAVAAADAATGGTDDPPAADDLVARILHVDPGVAPGDDIAVGDRLGGTIRSGFFAPWVDDHLHVGFRPAEANQYRAAGSLAVAADAAVEPLRWDGRGTVVETGDTYAVLDRPAHPAPGERFVGVATDDGRTVVDGGLPHYDTAGLLGRRDPGGESPAPTLLGAALSGRVAGADDCPTGDVRTVDVADLTVRVDGTPITGLSLFAGRAGFGAKLICPDRPLAVGDAVTVTVGGRAGTDGGPDP